MYVRYNRHVHSPMKRYDIEGIAIALLSTFADTITMFSIGLTYLFSHEC